MELVNFSGKLKIHARNGLFLILLCIPCFFVNLGLFDPDLMESRNFITAREMILNGTWIIPTMNGELRLEKQPLVTWFTALSALAGNTLTDPFMFRLPSAIISTIMVLFFYALCFQLSRKTKFALMGGTILATSLLVIQMARLNSWDIYTHAFMIGSIWLQIRAFSRPGKNSLVWIFAALLMGFSIFSKGPVSLYGLWIPFVVSYYFFNNKEQIKNNLKPLAGMLIFGLLSGFAWNLYVYLVIPEQATQVLIEETVSRSNQHVRPFYFYLHFPVYIGIWAIPLIASLFLKQFRGKINEEGNFIFLLSWILIGVFLLSIIPEKKERYMLPLAIPMSLMVTYLMYACYEYSKNGLPDKAISILLNIQAGLLVLILIVLPVGTFILKENDFYSIKFILITGLSLFFIVLLIRDIVNSNGLSKFRITFVSSVLVVILITSVYLPVVPDVIHNKHYKNIAEISDMKHLSNYKFVSAGKLNMELIWKIERPVIQIEMDTYDFNVAGEWVLFLYSPFKDYNVTGRFNHLDVSILNVYDVSRDKNSRKVYVYTARSER